MSFFSFNLPKNLAHLAHPDIDVVDVKKTEKNPYSKLLALSNINGKIIGYLPVMPAAGKTIYTRNILNATASTQGGSYTSPDGDVVDFKFAHQLVNQP